LNEYLFLMHQPPADAPTARPGWSEYFARLRATGQFAGGSAIGSGLCLSKSGAAVPTSGDLVGYLRVTAGSIEDARALLPGNPVFEAGGMVEIRELPKDNG
jgi:hypothetical protein